MCLLLYGLFNMVISHFTLVCVLPNELILEVVLLSDLSSAKSHSLAWANRSHLSLLLHLFYFIRRGIGARTQRLVILHPKVNACHCVLPSGDHSDLVSGLLLESRSRRIEYNHLLILLDVLLEVVPDSLLLLEHNLTLKDTLLSIGGQLLDIVRTLLSIPSLFTLLVVVAEGDE